ncbi:MAG TPA: 3-oxoacyl-[acyl-carrier-protein] reductase [Candidatus Paceibacterota bacterium]|nr:3-oxoacyl-[acyl-carrier-protein] reductase [Candidatus Pacearchaeota archaeon]HRZ51289.1 3-oxoacyl-[acyl-carrier-protein] reductase [Candidatus Paceibacterota bacterium]HSA37011.1 3-oxoacyl-[acyl-carrier-protein] reductase [Candidatus Paceibacterota bacterium]
MKTLENKVALITGSSQGIGKAIALKFASLGAKIALNDIAMQEENLKKLQEEIKETGVEAKYFMADVSKYDEVEAMMQAIQQEFGRLDILVNNAGIAKDRTLAKMTVEEWQKVIDINLTSVFNCSKTALPMLIQNQGNIISLSSFSGLRGNFGQTNYTAAKAGIIGFTKTLSKEVGKFGVRVNAVAPGFIESKMTEVMPEEVKAMVKKLTSLGRTGKPEEVASVIAFLAGPDASFITGDIINIDGGLAI